MVRTCVVHLVWAPLGPEPVERFVASVCENRAGLDHDLLVVLNGFDEGPSEAVQQALDRVAHRVLRLARPMQDLAAYREAVDETDADHVCFTNSYAQALVGGWLATLTESLVEPSVGLVGATGSWESAFSSAPAALRLQRLVGFPRFPNPHLRTNAFAAERALLLDLDWDGVRTKLGALELESGRRSITRQVTKRDLRTVVVGRDGVAYDPEQWLDSATFRAGSQRNLLVADNRTGEYERADPRERLRLARMAWGRRALGD